MTYALIGLPFLAVTALVVAATVRRPRFGARMASSGLTALALVVLTAIFDNVIIGVGLVSYPPGSSSGIRIGVAPIEDFAYAICAAFLVPAALCLLAPRRMEA